MTFAANTVVSAIDTNEAWFLDEIAEREALPGNNRVDDPINVLTRRQIGTIVRGLQRSELTRNLTLEAACDVARGRQMARLRGRQMDFNVVDFFANEENELASDDPLTLGQKRYIDRNVKALLGIEPHTPEIQAHIDRLTPAQKERFVDDFEGCTTRGQLSDVITRYERRVPNPRVNPSRSTAAEVVAGLNVETEEAF